MVKDNRLWTCGHRFESTFSFSKKKKPTLTAKWHCRENPVGAIIFFFTDEMMGKLIEGSIEGVILGILIKTGVDISPLGIGKNIIDLIQKMYVSPNGWVLLFGFLFF